MKCIRETDWGICYNTWNAMVKKAQKEMRQNHKYDYDYLDLTLPRYRIRRKVLHVLLKDTNAYWNTRYRLCHRYNQKVWGCR